MMVKLGLLLLLVAGFLFNGRTFAEGDKLQFGSQKDRPMIERVERVTLRKKTTKKKKAKSKAKDKIKAKKKKKQSA